MFWLNYVIPADEALINFDCHDENFTSESDSTVDFGAMLDAIAVKLNERFPKVSIILRNDSRHENGMGPFAVVHSDREDAGEIQEFVNDLASNFEFYDQFFREKPAEGTLEERILAAWGDLETVKSIASKIGEGENTTRTIFNRLRLAGKIEEFGPNQKNKIYRKKY